MRVVLRPDSDAEMVAALADSDDLTSFCVEIPPRFRPSPGAAVGPVRFSSATQAWVDRDWLLRAGAFDSPARAEAFEAMVAVAARQGWIDPQSGAVAGHVAAPPADPDRGPQSGAAEGQTEQDSQTAKE